MNARSSKGWILALAAISLPLSVGSGILTAVASPAIATIQEVSGRATVVRQGQTLPAVIGQEIRDNDTLRTGPDASMGVIFQDDTVLSLGPESYLVLLR